MIKILVLCLLTVIAFCKGYTCEFGKLYRNSTNKWEGKPDLLLSDELSMQPGRLLQATARASIRITLDTTNFSTIYTPLSGEAKTTTTNLNFIKKAMQVAQFFFEKRLKVSTVSRVFAPQFCQDFYPPSNDVSNGISSSDLHIYVRHTTNKYLGYGATGKSCKYINKTTPDPTFQAGRPTVGRMIFNTYNIIDDETVLTNRLFAQITSTALHETIHILGFDFSLYGAYLDQTTSSPYSYTPTTTLKLHDTRSAINGDHHIMRTPKVLQWAQDHYDCNSLTGMPLQNEEGLDDPSTVPSHWERASIYDELMTGTALGTQKAFTGLTFALLKDMGWYQVDDTFNDTINYGYHQGCSFVTDACYGATSFPKYFCSVSDYSGVSECSTTFLGKAVCTDQSGIMSDGCGIFGEYTSCVDPDNSGDSYKAYTFEKYDTDSFCVKSTFGNVIISQKYRGRCYPYQCIISDSASYINFFVGNYIIKCDNDTDIGTQKTSSGLQGFLQCPDFTAFCVSSRKTCENWCSGNGFCTRGICNCFTGFFGADCSKTQCNDEQYWDKKTASCVTECPSGTYENQYSHACEFCSSQCQQCRDQPTICTGCLSTQANPLYFYSVDTLCYEQCPDSTYQAGDECFACDIATSFCLTCSGIDTNCTSCSQSGGTLFLNETTGICDTTCETAKYDIVNYICIDVACKENLMTYGTGDTCSECPAGYQSFCDFCPDNQYKFTTNLSCIDACPERYYADDERHFCEKCHDTCLECEGPYAQNCTACSPTEAQQFLLITMCVTGCPRGYYPSESAHKCLVCPVQTNCATCELNADEQVVCLTCKYGYYLQSDDTCLDSCPQYYYKNKWNYTCDQCHPDCGDCTTSAESSCVNCKTPRFFLNNITGGFCLDECPTQLYTQSGQSCLDCYETCLTCHGVNSNDCLSCQEGYFLYSGMCRYVCPPGTYRDTESRTCSNCDSSCTFCFGATVDNCTACIGGLVLDNFTCAASCSHNLTVNQWNVCFQSTIVTNLLFCIFTLLLLSVRSA